MNSSLGLVNQPANISFIEQEPDERIELIVRKHWITLLPGGLLVIIGLLIPVIIVGLLQLLHLNLQDIKESQVIIGIWLWYLLALCFGFETFLFWYYNTYIISSKHIVFITFRGIYTRDIIEHHYDDIQSVSSHVEGLTASFINIGSVTVEMLGQGGQLELDQIPFPEQVAERIEDVKDQLGNKNG